MGIADADASGSLSAAQWVDLRREAALLGQSEVFALEAVKLYRRVLRGQERLLGTGHRDTAQTAEASKRPTALLQ